MKTNYFLESLEESLEEKNPTELLFYDDIGYVTFFKMCHF